MEPDNTDFTGRFAGDEAERVAAAKKKLREYIETNKAMHQGFLTAVETIPQEFAGEAQSYRQQFESKLRTSEEFLAQIDGCSSRGGLQELLTAFKQALNENMRNDDAFRLANISDLGVEKLQEFMKTGIKYIALSDELNALLNNQIIKTPEAYDAKALIAEMKTLDELKGKFAAAFTQDLKKFFKASDDLTAAIFDSQSISSRALEKFGTHFMQSVEETKSAAMIAAMRRDQAKRLLGLCKAHAAFQTSVSNLLRGGELMPAREESLLSLLAISQDISKQALNILDTHFADLKPDGRAGGKR